MAPDAHWASCHQPIVMHDETLTRTTNCTGAVSNVDYYGFVEYCIAGQVRWRYDARSSAHALGAS